MILTLRWQTTKISSVLSPRYSAKLRSPFVAEPPKLFRLKCASHRYTANTNSTHFKWNNSLVCRVSAPMQPRFNRIEAGLPRTKASL
jgi:hypothetical protein